MKEETFNNPCENVFFVFEFDLQEDRDLILSLRLLITLVRIYFLLLNLTFEKIGI